MNTLKVVNQYLDDLLLDKPRSIAIQYGIRRNMSLTTTYLAKSDSDCLSQSMMLWQLQKDLPDGHLKHRLLDCGQQYLSQIAYVRT